ncbi:hypothetical protein J6A34_03875 [bacterium]|nr:hypothetical protein [bacterium]
MKLNSITSAITKEVNLESLAKKAQEVTDVITERISRPQATPKISAARVNLELNAENMSPNDYIAARSYIAGLEMEELIASEMKMFR